jgi:hypothetical protein
MMPRPARRVVRTAVAVAALVALSGCGSIPQPRRDAKLEQTANKADVAEILDRYREVRNAAISLLDPKPLSIVESGPMLAIDSGSFAVSQRLSRTQSEDERQLQITSVETPTFSRYPLWFMVTAYDPAARVDLVQIFERSTPVDPWLLVAAPQTIPSTELPGLRHDGQGHVIPVAANNGKGMKMSPQEAAAAYAKALGSMTGRSPGVVRDDFISKMRTAFDQANRLEGVRVTQTWAAEHVEQALRTNDGGSLVWVTLLRLDTYTVQPGIKVSWPAGSPQQAFLTNGISSSGKLRYYHQVLLYLPGNDGEPRALGQFGGVVGADAQAVLAPVPAPIGTEAGGPAPFPLPAPTSGTPSLGSAGEPSPSPSPSSSSGLKSILEPPPSLGGN